MNEKLAFSFSIVALYAIVADHNELAAIARESRGSRKCFQEIYPVR
jgi:hypothetical protein